MTLDQGVANIYWSSCWCQDRRQSVMHPVLLKTTNLIYNANDTVWTVLSPSLITINQQDMPVSITILSDSNINFSTSARLSAPVTTSKYYYSRRRTPRSQPKITAPSNKASASNKACKCFRDQATRPLTRIYSGLQMFSRSRIDKLRNLNLAMKLYVLNLHRPFLR